ncbi:MAG: sulfite reductase subunit alpha [Xanthomonadaceae bacterium]|nr:sulfite reductase subunit alpha [Xanthomonadaceae bacterium]
MGFCTWFFERRRKSNTSNNIADPSTILVVWASQNGFARELAERTAAALTTAGRSASLLPLDQLNRRTIEKAARILFVASTTGEGSSPDHALGFIRDTMAKPVDLNHLHYSVLALGNREYGNFCAFGHRIDNWLRDHGALSLFDLIEVDDIDADAIRSWQYHVNRLAEIKDQADWLPMTYQNWRLVERRCLNPGSLGNPVFHIALRPGGVSLPDWQAGDILEVSPRHAGKTVADYLTRHGMDGEVLVDIDGHEVRLSEILSRSHLPSESELPAQLKPQTLAGLLHPLPHREYSIASLPDDGSLWLLVRWMPYPDGRPGLGSGWLCEHAPLDGDIAVRVRSNPNFHAPDPDKPMILIGNGTGIASLRSLLKARIAAGSRNNWLVFGERQSERDFFYQEEIETWQAQGWLMRLDLAFSRDTDEKRYVQHPLQEAGPTLQEWVKQNASLYVCGSLEGMAPAVDAVLDSLLGIPVKERLLAERRYRRDVY